jgi:hypothetical protein
VIDIDKLSLPVCALGAGAAHVVVLGLVLPMSIALPGPSESMTPTRVAISVEISSTKILPEAPVASPVVQPEVSQAQPEVSSAQPELSLAQPELSLAQPLETEPPETQPDTINAVLQNVSVTTVTTNAPELVSLRSDTNDITGSLPEAASVMEEEATPSDVVPAEIIPAEIVSSEVILDEVASVDEVIPPLPTRVRRDVQGNAVISVRRAAPAAKPVRPARANPRPVTTKRATRPFRGPLDALFGKLTNNRTR